MHNAIQSYPTTKSHAPFHTGLLFGISAYHSGMAFALGTARRRSSRISRSSTSASCRRTSSFTLSASSSLRLTIASNLSRSLARCSVQKLNGTTATLASGGGRPCNDANRGGLGSQRSGSACPGSLAASRSSLRASSRASTRNVNPTGFVNGTHNVAFCHIHLRKNNQE